MEDPERALRRHPADPAVDVHGLPALEHAGIELREIGLHREARLRQVQRGLVVHKIIGKSRSYWCRISKGTTTLSGPW